MQTPIPPNELEQLRARELLARDFPPREWIVEGLLKQRQLALVYAASGLGKSWLSWSIACLVAGTGYGLKDYSNDKPRKVLVIDGEMDLEDAQERVQILGKALHCDMNALGKNLTIISRQAQKPSTDFIDLDSKEWRTWVLEKCRKESIEFMVLDNLSTLLKVEDENSSAAMDGLTDFLLALKRAGVSALVVHHSNKAGSSYRGSQKISVTFDLILSLTKPATKLSEGACFEVTFEKVRGRIQDLPFRLILEGDAWLHEEGDKQAELTVAALKTGRFTSYQGLADGLGCAKSTAHVRVQKAVQLGLVTPEEIERCFERAKTGLMDIAGLDGEEEPEF